MTENPLLTQLLVSDIPPALVRRILKVFPTVYADAYAQVRDHPQLGEPEAKYLLGHLRRALFETQFRDIAIDCGLRVTMHAPPNGGCEHVQVMCGRFRLIACHVQSPGAFPQHSDCREQYAGINEHISQADWLAVPSEPGEEALFGILTHASERRDQGQFRCAQIGFPDPGFYSWVEQPADLLDLRDLQVTAYQASDDLQGQKQDAAPKWKKRHDTEQRADQPGEDL